MTWKNLQNQGRVEKHVTSKAELDDLRAVIQRNLDDASIEELFDRCRRKRNDLSYDSLGVVSEADVIELEKRAAAFFADVEAWIAAKHPTLA